MWKHGGIKIEFTAGRYFVEGGGDAEISENLCFFIKRSVAPNLQIETFLGPAPTDSPRTPSYSCPKSGEGGKTGSASKNRHRNEKKTRPQFSKESSENE